MADMLRTISISVKNNSEKEIDDEINGVFQAVAWALRTTVSTTMKTSPGQVIFGRDMIFDFNIRTNWEAIDARRLRTATRNNERENSTRRQHNYKVDDEVLLANDGGQRRKIGDTPFFGPYKIVRVNKNGTIKIRRDRFDEVVNIRRVKPYNNAE